GSEPRNGLRQGPISSCVAWQVCATLFSKDNTHPPFFSPDNIRLVGETSRCAGRLEMKHLKDWRPLAVSFDYWNMNSAAVVYSVRLVQGTNRCSGRLEVKTNQSWSSVCEKDFDLQDAEVVCREIGCGSPSVLQGALYGEAEAPVGSREFLCEGSESALLTCSSRKSSVRNSCSPGQAVGLTCSGRGGSADLYGAKTAHQTYTDTNKSTRNSNEPKYFNNYHATTTARRTTSSYSTGGTTK
uniref:SRCR domain-containing protein n=1 Tax=Poecilia mexicana TaxID=48701 RepID=A0A3B3YGV5_9TELE